MDYEKMKQRMAAKGETLEDRIKKASAKRKRDAKRLRDFKRGKKSNT